MTEAAVTTYGQFVPLLRTTVRPTGPVRRQRTAGVRPVDPAVTTRRAWLVVLDGTAGSPLVEIAESLPLGGADLSLLPGRLGRPGRGDEAEQRARWLTQGVVASGLARPVLVQGDWVGGLAMAAALAVRDGGRLLAARAGWAVQCLAAGLLRPADMYAVVDLNPADSLARMAELPAGDPWRDGVVVEQLRAFWLSPAAALRAYPRLAHALRSVRVRRLDGRLPPAELAERLCRSGQHGFVPQTFLPRPAASRL